MGYRLAKNGHLHCYREWDVSFAISQLKLLGLIQGDELPEDYKDVIFMIRDHFEQYQRIPIDKMVVRMMAHVLGSDRGNQAYLNQLFPGGTRQLCLVAGLNSCRFL